MAGKIYTVFTDLDPDQLTEIMFELMKKWIAFAMGEDTINGHRVQSPTGRYASSIRLEGRAVNEVAIVADEDIAPEAAFLEEGHGAVDLKQHLTPGRAYPMHRGAGAPILNSTFGGRARNVWAVPRAAGFNGFARVPSEITAENADSWIIPPMAAWSPAQHLSDLLEQGAVLGYGATIPGA
jgi:hypothetical protein